MSKTVSKFAFTASLVFAMAFVFSCSGDDGNDDNGNSSSSGTTQEGGSSSSLDESGVFVDPRDGKEYGFETAPNGRIWMSENLNYSRDNTLGYCYGVDINEENAHRDSTTCDNGYGRVYEYATAVDGSSPQGLCPPDWHIPTADEWSSITNNPTFCGRIIMSNNFCISAGNYNTNSKYPPLGWKERDYSGFYWTSSGYAYFAGLWHCSPTSNPTSNGCMDVQNSATEDSYFSIRCIADSNVKSNSFITPSSSSIASLRSSSSINSSTGPDLLYEGQTYRTVKIGTQTWLAENLNYNPGTGTSACYDNVPSNCDIYGRLYDWETAKTVCPPDWHLPSRAEWNVLGNDAKKLKATSGWNGTNDYGFSALPGGGGGSDGGFDDVGYGGYWWSASRSGGPSASGRYMGYDDDAYWYNFDESNLFSVRCVQD